MAQEILRLRSAMAVPWAVVEPLGAKYVVDGRAAMIWPARLAARGDIYLYRLPHEVPDLTEVMSVMAPQGRKK
ncbi:hypothetical protein HA45_20575 [Pantoea rodasii]|uniref:hypothetical protein n=1 Tax=Pantoea rodasii TaxID=1076549 RepID=UPI000A2616F0|nr:hypothetical protein [Pantoea rodasii]ORM61539.1 hypothetical protein HA45_20575 [Pantoea rodasii]